jgi:hypothetical protein
MRRTRNAPRRSRHTATTWTTPGDRNDEGVRIDEDDRDDEGDRLPGPRPSSLPIASSTACESRNDSKSTGGRAVTAAAPAAALAAVSSRILEPLAGHPARSDVSSRNIVATRIAVASPMAEVVHHNGE